VNEIRDGVCIGDIMSQADARRESLVA